ncbi:hypothetical protein RB195_022593 [Necator americanus]|uniref:Uncharacterized protein n=1 Tax=Necator americanus TaxID=51031 RepID=A0ABR1EFU6_NECAM
MGFGGLLDNNIVWEAHTAELCKAYNFSVPGAYTRRLDCVQNKQSQRDQFDDGCGSSTPSKELSLLQPDPCFTVVSGNEIKPPTISEKKPVGDIVLPKTQLRQDSLSDLITPDKILFHSNGTGSPLKMLVDSHIEFSNNDGYHGTFLLSQGRIDTDLYNLPSTGLSVSDLFISSDWEIPR